jgi:SAM-dependent methyltransferase
VSAASETPGAAPPKGLRKRIRALWKRSLFNPHHIERRLLWESIAAESGALGGRMLDVGCGDRPYAALFRHVERYVGLEHPGAVMNVEAELRRSFERVRGLIDAFGDANEIPFRDASFDSCLSTEVLEHVPDPVSVAREIRRILRPGGRVLLTVPFAGELHQTPYDFRRYTIFGIRRVLEEAGFEVERVRPRGNFPLVAGLVTSHAIYRLGAREIRPDGSVSLWWWSIPAVFPAVAAVQLLASLLGRLSRDAGYCVGYAVVARRPAA